MPPLLPRPNQTSSDSSMPNGSSAQLDLNRPLPPPPLSAADYEIPTLRRKPIPEAPGRARPKHTRSSSHPFPSLFGGRRSDKKQLLKTETNVFDTTDDDNSINEDAGQTNGFLGGPSRQPIPKINKEPVTGKCMTCDSTVRWPQGLKVYRCTICLTINDLEPFLEPRKSQDGANLFPATTAQRRPLPLSIDRTRSIIDQCLTEYLENRLNPKTSLDSMHPSPPQSPVKDSIKISTAFLSISPPNSNSLQPQSPENPSEIASRPRSPRPGLKARSPSEPSRSPRYPTFGPNGSSGIDQEPKYLPTPTSGLQLSDQASVKGNDLPGSENEMTTLQDRSANPAIFLPLESYIAGCFTGCGILNSSFFTIRPQPSSEQSKVSEERLGRPSISKRRLSHSENDAALSELDAKTLLLGDVAENGSWWAGNRTGQTRTDNEHQRSKSPESWKGVVSHKTPRINWTDLADWYRIVIHAGDNWQSKWRDLYPRGHDNESLSRKLRWESIDMEEIEQEVIESRIHLQRSLLKSTENLLKRPRRPLKHPEDCRFLFMLLANPLLGSPTLMESIRIGQEGILRPSVGQAPRPAISSSPPKRQPSGPRRRLGGPGSHAGIIKRLLGLISNLPNEVHQFVVSWFSRLSDSFLLRYIEIIGSFVTYRLPRQHSRKKSEPVNPTDSLVPSFSEGGVRHPSQLHAAIESRTSTSKSKSEFGKPNISSYGEDWQVKAAARVMSLLFMANMAQCSRRRENGLSDKGMHSVMRATKYKAHIPGQLIPISCFYNTMLDYADLVADFEVWEANRGKFSFCQYPFFLSIWAKIHILEYDARRQMEVKAREAFFDSILSRKAISQYLVLKVRRDCLVEDSLRSVSEVIGSGGEEIKKGLRIDFVGEEGVDAGGLRKEWFLLLVREIFDPNHGLFNYDEDSQFCYFNPFCFESSEQFFLVGVLLGLAIYNSTILDVAFPPFVFKKILASAPASNTPASSTPRLVHKFTLEDLAEYRPALARGLSQLLEFDGDVQETFCRDFIVDIDRYGEIVQVPLFVGGEKKPVTNANRREFVELYVQYLLDTAVARQYEPFKRGFFTVCGGNALSLFRPEEIELLIRGSDETLDIASLRAVAAYEGWPNGNREVERQPQVIWFWEFFERSSPADQRRILSFITGSDRIPGMGATNLIIRIVLLGFRNGVAYETDRFPSARTCFNMLMLYAYEDREKLEERLWSAVTESEGFGLK